MSLRERIEWLFRMAFLAFVLASIAFLSALTAMRFAIQGREVSMPDVVGMKAITAEHTLQGRGVGMRVEDRIYSNLPIDSVVRQSPNPSMRVKIGQFAHVVLSLGPQRATIPKLEDDSLRAARIELLRSGLQVGEISSVYLPGSTDQVIKQDPPPGATDNASPHVDFLVSLGPRPPAYVMPDLTGSQIGDAEAKLRSAGLKAAKITLTPTAAAVHGSVITQTPVRGQRVDANSNIELQVAE